MEKKKWDMGEMRYEIYTFLLDFANSLFRSEKRNLLMFRSDFSRWGVRSKSITKMPYGK